MRKLLVGVSALVLAGALAGAAVHAQVPRGNEYEGEVSSRTYAPVTKRTKIPTKETFIPLSNNANAVMLEPVTPDPQRSKFVLLITHPEHINNFDYFIAPQMASRGYRVMMVNYYGNEVIYEEYLAPLAAAVKYLRGLPDVQKIVMTGHSGGGAVLTYYQDVAENGAKACNGPERMYPCKGKIVEALPPVDGVMNLDARAGVVERLVTLDPAITNEHPNVRNAALDLFDPKNGFDPKTKSGTYTPAFEKAYLKAQAERQRKLIADAKARLALIEAGKGLYQDDEPFIYAGSSLHTNDGAALTLSDVKLLSKTHAPHLLLKADGTRPVQIVPTTYGGLTQPEEEDRLGYTTQEVTVRNFLSYLAMDVGPDYNITEDRITGVNWRSVANSLPGNAQGVHVPSLFMAGTCASHVVYLETAYDLSPAADKEFVAVEGANHAFAACKPEYGDPTTKAFDYVDSWLMKPGRF